MALRLGVAFALPLEFHGRPIETTCHDRSPLATLNLFTVPAAAHLNSANSKPGCARGRISGRRDAKVSLSYSDNSPLVTGCRFMSTKL